MRKALSIFLAGIMLNPALIGAAPNPGNRPAPKTSTPIQHIVVIFQENISFDHYFATYPVAANPSGEPPFHAAAGTPSVNGLSGALLTNNPNLLNTNNGSGATNPFRLDRSQNLTADQDHDYTPEQQAFDAGLMDLFPFSVGTAGPPPNAPPQQVLTTGLTMGYYDGNTTTALWNLAQNFAMSDNSYGTNFGPSTVGAINLISGQTNGVTQTLNGTGDETDGGAGSLTVIGDPNPIGDVCTSPTSGQAQMGGPNIGNLLSAQNISWGWFEGGFNLNTVNPNGTTGCSRSHTSAITGVTESDYIPHHQPFQYYASTSNPNHTRPTSVSLIGQNGDAANHQYDIDDFAAALQAGNFPAVSFLKALGIQDGHAGYSSPLDEQQWIVSVLNLLQQQPDWGSTLVIIAYDDSDGWYDHQIAPITNQSNGAADALTGPGACGNGNFALPGVASNNPHAIGRCGYGPRQPLLVISPFAKQNFVDHTVTDQTSIIRFIEDNWLAGQRLGSGSFDALANSVTNMLNFRNAARDVKVILDENTGEVK
jgi:phospholipase C